MLSEDSVEKALPDFDTLANELVRAGGFGSPSELHGCLCGHLAAGDRYEPASWLSTAAEILEISELSDQGLAESLHRLYQVSLEQLTSGDFSFSLLMPDDETAMAQRSEALGLWCHGFLSGYSIAGGVEDKLSEDARDAFRDMVQVAQIALDSDDDGNEADFVEVYEYIRMSGLLIFAECNEPALSESVPPGESLH